MRGILYYILISVFKILKSKYLKLTWKLSLFLQLFPILPEITDITGIPLRPPKTSAGEYCEETSWYTAIKICQISLYIYSQNTQKSTKILPPKRSTERNISFILPVVNWMICNVKIKSNNNSRSQFRLIIPERSPPIILFQVITKKFKNQI